MHARRISILVLIVLLVVAGIAWLVAQWPQPQIISLPDGSRLTLLNVTYGTNHVCRFGNRLQDLLHPFLPPKIRAKFPPRVTEFPTSSETLMIWLRYDATMINRALRPPFFLAVADENGLETGLLAGANLTRTLSSQNAPAATPSGTLPVKKRLGRQTTSQISGWELREYPRRARQFTLRVYPVDINGDAAPVNDFLVRNPGPRRLPTWTAETLPARRLTNGLEIILTRLETGLPGKETSHGQVGGRSKSFSRAAFRVNNNRAPTEAWNICRISAWNAEGGFRPGGSCSSRWQSGELWVDFEAGLWLEETWKLTVDLMRTGDFPPDELWVIKRVRVPRPGELVEQRVITNLLNTELEFLGASGPDTSLAESHVGVQSRANIHLRTPLLLGGVRVVLVQVRDDQGRQSTTCGSTARTSMGGRGNTPREMLHGFAIELPEDAKSLDITFAATRVRRVEFLAKPVMFASNPETRKSKPEGSPNQEDRH